MAGTRGRARSAALAGALLVSVVQCLVSCTKVTKVIIIQEVLPDASSEDESGASGASSVAGGSGSSELAEAGNAPSSGGSAATGGAETDNGGTSGGGAGGASGDGMGGAAGVSNGGTSAGGAASGGTAAGGTSGAAGASAGSAGSAGAPFSDVCPAGVLGHCDPGATAASYPAYAGYTLALVEDFPAPIDLDTDPIFTWSDGSPTNSQTRFRKEQLSFSEGSLWIQVESPCAAQTSNSQCVPAYNSYASSTSAMNPASIAKTGVWSGELRTRYNNYRYGRYEARIKNPSANPGHEADSFAGSYLSSLITSRAPAWQNRNELDLSFKPTPLTNCNGGAFLGTQSQSWNTAGALPAAYKITDSHLYAITWTPSGVNWYVDGVSAAAIGGANTPRMSAKIMMNIWVSAGTQTGLGGNNRYPFQVEYEYFRFYKLNRETTYPCAPAPSCLPAADKPATAQNNPAS